MTAPVPMNRAQRRKAGVSVKPETVPFTLALLSRRERQAEDGVVFAQSYFQLVAPNGKILQEETPDGPQPVIIASVAQPVRKSLVVKGPTLVTAR